MCSQSSVVFELDCLKSLRGLCLSGFCITVGKQKKVSYYTLLVYSVHYIFINALLSLLLLFVSLTYYLYRFVIARGETANIKGNHIIFTKAYTSSAHL